MKTKKTASGIRVYCSHDKIVPIDELVPNPQNPNQHPDEQIELLAKIIQENGWRNAITVSNLSGMIVKGHGRYAAAQLAGLDEAPVDYQDYESESDEVRDLMADNKISELSKVDMDLAMALIRDLPDIDLEFDLPIFGFTDIDIDELQYLSDVMPVSGETQSRLDEKKGIICPDCGFVFNA